MKQTVLMYHDVFRDSVKESGFQTDGANHYKITEAAFSEQLSLLKGRPTNADIPLVRTLHHIPLIFVLCL